jgi:hypothetical protein
MTHTPITSFKKFLRKQAPITLITLPHKNKVAKIQEEAELGEDLRHAVHNLAKTVGMGDAGSSYLKKNLAKAHPDKVAAAHRYLSGKKPHERTGDDIAHVNHMLESEQLDELFHAATPQNSKKGDDLHAHLSDYYNIDAGDKEGVGIFQKFHNHINKALGKAAAPKEEKSKPDPVDAEQEKYGSDASAAGKKIDQLLAAHKSPAKEFHIYTGLKGHPFEQMKKEQGYDYDPDSEEPIEASIPGFAQASIDPTFAKENAGKAGHVLKLAVAPGSKHGAYVGHVNGDGHDREFLMRPGRKLRLSPQPEMHGDTSIWHGQLTGETGGAKGGKK